MTMDILRSVFPDVPALQLAPVASYLPVVTVEYGQTIMEEGDDDLSLAFVIDGELAVTKRGLPLGAVLPGQMFGEVAFFSGEPRNATVKTVTDTTLVVIERAAYDELRAADHPVAWEIELGALGNIVYGLREAHNKVAAYVKATGRVMVVPAPTFMERMQRNLGMWGRKTGNAAWRSEVLRALPHFEHLDDATLRDLAGSMTAMTFKDGQYLCRHGDEANEMYLLADGTMWVLVPAGDGQSVPVVELGPGQFLGVTSVLEERRRTASLVAHGEATVLALSKSDWIAIAGATAQAGSALRVAMIGTLGAQLAHANDQLVEFGKHEMDDVARDFRTPVAAPQREATLFDLAFRD